MNWQFVQIAQYPLSDIHIYSKHIHIEIKLHLQFVTLCTCMYIVYKVSLNHTILKCCTNCTSCIIEHHPICTHCTAFTICNPLYMYIVYQVSLNHAILKCCTSCTSSMIEHHPICTHCTMHIIVHHMVSVHFVTLVHCRWHCWCTTYTICTLKLKMYLWCGRYVIFLAIFSLFCLSFNLNLTRKPSLKRKKK